MRSVESDFDLQITNRVVLGYVFRHGFLCVLSFLSWCSCPQRSWWTLRWGTPTLKCYYGIAFYIGVWKSWKQGNLSGFGNDIAVDVHTDLFWGMVKLRRVSYDREKEEVGCKGELSLTPVLSKVPAELPCCQMASPSAGAWQRPQRLPFEASALSVGHSSCMRAWGPQRCHSPLPGLLRVPRVGFQCAKHAPSLVFKLIHAPCNNHFCVFQYGRYKCSHSSQFTNKFP